LVGRKLAECAANRKSQGEANFGNPKKHIAAPPDFRDSLRILDDYMDGT